MRLPIKGKWQQLNRGDILGELFSSFNLDLVINQGAIRGTRLVTRSSTSTDSGLSSLGLPVGFVRHNDGGGVANAPFYTVAGTGVFKSTSPTFPTGFTADASGSDPSNCSSALSDLIVFNDNLYVSQNNANVAKKSTGAWSSFSASNDSNPHMFCVYANRLYMTTATSKIISWNTSDSVSTSGANTMQLSSAGLGTSSENNITCIRAVSDGIWIFTVNILGGNGVIYKWNGVTADTFDKAYILESSGAMAAIIKDDIPYVMDNWGRLLAFNGGTFVELARLPIYSQKVLNGALNPTNTRWIHPNGMALVNGKIDILVSLGMYSNSTQNEEQAPSGIWEYDRDIGLYHKYSPSYYDTGVDSLTDWGQSRVVNSTGAGNESGAGGIYSFINNSDTAGREGTIVCGFKYYSDATTTKYGIFYDDNTKEAQTASYFTTVRIPSGNIQEMWKRLYVFHKKFLDQSNDKIVVKYRIDDVIPTEGTITWIDTTHFITSVDLSTYAIGDEVEILQGTGGGMSSHIVNLQSGAGGTYIVQVDEIHTGVTTGTAIARFQKWIKAGTVNDSGYFGKVKIDSPSPFIQLKVFFLFGGKDEIRYLELSSIKHEQAD